MALVKLISSCNHHNRSTYLVRALTRLPHICCAFHSLRASATKRKVAEIVFSFNKSSFFLNKNVIQLNTPKTELKRVCKRNSSQFYSIMVLQTMEFDPMCDKDHPQSISFEEVSAAAFRIEGGVVKTSCVKSHMTATYGMDIYLKNDFLQYTGSFKERGARNALLLLSPDAKRCGVISASLGNHSQALSYHAQQLGIPVIVIMPNIAPIMKIQNCRSYGAEVIIHGNDMKDAKFHAMTLAKKKGLTYINGYDHPHIMAGQGTLGLEIVEQVPEVDAVLVPIGGGGLIAGVATAVKYLKPNVLIYGVETEKCPSMKAAMEAGSPESVTIHSTLADGLAVPMVGYNAFLTVKTLIDKLITVNEDWLARAILRLAEQEKYVTEGAGAVGIAAIMAGQVPELANKKVVCVLSGGNIDTTILGRCLERGLAAERRLVKFKVTVSDRPGSIAELCKTFTSMGVSIKDIMHERAWVYGDIFSVVVKVVCETTGPEQTEQLRTAIAKNYKESFFTKGHDETLDERLKSHTTNTLMHDH